MILKLLEKLLTRPGGESFKLDRHIPTSYLVRFLFDKAFGVFRAILHLGPRYLGRITLAHGSNIILSDRLTIRGKVSIGRNCYIDCLSKDGVDLGNSVSIGDNVVIKCTGSLKAIGKGLILGDNVGIGDSSFLGCAGGIIIGDDTIIGNFVSFHSEEHSFGDMVQLTRLQGVTRQGIEIGANCWIGAKTTVLDGAKISSGSVVAAGSVVRRGKYPPNVVLAGVPARIVKTRG